MENESFISEAERSFLQETLKPNFPKGIAHKSTNRSQQEAESGKGMKTVGGILKNRLLSIQRREKVSSARANDVKKMIHRGLKNQVMAKQLEEEKHEVH